MVLWVNVSVFGGTTCIIYKGRVVTHLVFVVGVTIQKAERVLGGSFAKGETFNCVNNKN